MSFLVRYVDAHHPVVDVFMEMASALSGIINSEPDKESGVDASDDPISCIRCRRHAAGSGPIARIDADGAEAVEGKRDRPRFMHGKERI